MKNKIRPLTYSMVKSFNICPKLFEFEYIQLLAPLKFHFPFLVGDASHNGILTLLEYKDLDYAIAASHIAMDEFREKYEEIATLSVEEEQEFIYQKTILEGLLKGYYVYNRKFVEEVNVIQSETQMLGELELPGEFTVVIKPDAIIEYKDVYPYELKSAGRLDLENIMRYYPQMLFYYLNLKSEHFSEGYYFDGIKKPGIRVKKTEQIEDYIQRLEDYYADPETLANEIIVMRPRALRQMEKLIQETAEKILDCEKQGVFRENRFSCRIYNPCPFLKLCDHGQNPVTMMKFRNKTSPNEELEEMMEE